MVSCIASGSADADDPPGVTPFHAAYGHDSGKHSIACAAPFRLPLLGAGAGIAPCESKPAIFPAAAVPTAESGMSNWMRTIPSSDPYRIATRYPNGTRTPGANGAKLVLQTAAAACSPWEHPRSEAERLTFPTELRLQVRIAGSVGLAVRQNVLAGEANS